MEPEVAGKGFLPPEIWAEILRAATSVPDPMQIPSSLDLIDDECPAIQAMRKRYNDALVRVVNESTSMRTTLTRTVVDQTIIGVGLQAMEHDHDALPLRAYPHCIRGTNGQTHGHTLQQRSRTTWPLDPPAGSAN